MSRAQSCQIPIPLSANQMWMPLKTKKGRVFMAKTGTYKDWLLECGMKMRMGMDKVTTYPVSVRIEVRGGLGFPLRRDLDNCLKGVLDALRGAGVLANDRVSEVTQVSAEYYPAVDKERDAVCTVIVKQLEDGLFE